MPTLFDRLPKRVQFVVNQMREGQRLCRSYRLKESGETEVTYIFEPSGKRCGPKSAEAAIGTKFVMPLGDGLLGPESSQTFTAAQ